MRWERVQLRTQQEQVVQGLPFNEVISTSGPGKRWGHTCNAVKGGRLLYVFGGYGREKSQKITNQVHVFDIGILLLFSPFSQVSALFVGFGVAVSFQVRFSGSGIRKLLVRVFNGFICWKFVVEQ